MLRMKNFNILGIHWKTRLSGGSSRKTNIEGGLPKKGGLRQFGDLREVCQEREKGVIPQCTLCMSGKKLIKLKDGMYLLYLF